MTIETLKSPNQEIGTVYPWKNQNFYPSLRWKLCWPFWKALTRDVTSYWQAECTTDFLGDTSPPPLSIVFVFGCLEENLNRKLLQNSFVLWHRLTLYIEFGLENCNIPVVINFLSQVIFVFLFFGAGWGGGWEGGMVMYANEVETKQKIEITWDKKMTITLHRRHSTQYILHN